MALLSSSLSTRASTQWELWTQIGVSLTLKGQFNNQLCQIFNQFSSLTAGEVTKINNQIHHHLRTLEPIEGFIWQVCSQTRTPGPALCMTQTQDSLITIYLTLIQPRVFISRPDARIKVKIQPTPLCWPSRREGEADPHNCHPTKYNPLLIPLLQYRRGHNKMG